MYPRLSLLHDHPCPRTTTPNAPPPSPNVQNRPHVPQSKADAVAALSRLRVKALKQIIRSERIRVQPGTLVEKKDFVEAIAAARDRAIDTSTDPVAQLLQRPRLLIVGDNNNDGNGHTGDVHHELYPKAALRFAKQDETRTRIAASELTSFTFHIRVRGDGPMGEVTHMDPWYSNRGHGVARFADDFTVTFTWPTVDGVEMNPFAQMGMSNPLTLRWAMENGGAVIRILFGA